MKTVRFIGEGSYNLARAGQNIPYTTGTSLDLDDAVADKLLSRTRGGKPQWEQAAKVKAAKPTPDPLPEPAPVAAKA